MLGRIVRSQDFERVLAQPARARSPHFAIHFALHEANTALGRPNRRALPLRLAETANGVAGPELSTDTEPAYQQLVDDPAKRGAVPSRATLACLGTVVPKRHARRAVTRTLIKRQIRSAARRMEAAGQGLEPGLWVVRLRAPFDRTLFTSAASVALRSAARGEIGLLLSKCGRRA